MRIDGPGNITLGAYTIPDSAKVTVVGTKALSSGIPQQQLNVYDNATLATGTGGAIAFSANYTGSSPTTMGSIEGVRENGTSGNYAGALVFKTRANGANNNEQMRISSLGYVTTPSQPAFHAVANGTGALTGTIANFPSALVNISNSYSTSTMRFTAPIAGTYYFYGAIMANSGTGRLTWQFYKNGAGISYNQGGGDSTNYGTWTGAMTITLAANDYIQINVGTGTPYNSSQEQSFGGYLLG